MSALVRMMAGHYVTPDGRWLVYQHKSVRPAKWWGIITDTN